MSTIQGTFTTGVQAMLAQAHDLSNISTNIANVNTTGYKEQGTHFSTLLDETQPVDAKFFTVRTYDFRNVDKQGTITSTQRTFDVALNGRGFLVTNTAQDGTGIWQYTRDGAFFGKAVTLSTSTNGNGQLDQGTLLTTADGSYVYGWAADANGNISEANDLKTLTPIMFNNNSVFPSKATTTLSLQANLPADIKSRQNVGVPFIDASGSTRTLTIGFTPAGGSNWSLDMSSIDNTTNQPVSVTFNPPTVSFDPTAKIISPSPAILTATINDATGPQMISVDVSKLTQFGGDKALTVQNITQDGYIVGRLNNTYFDQNGVLIGSYSNGQVRNLYKLPVASFAADNNLDAVTGNSFVQTAAAGSLNLKGVGNPYGQTQFVPGSIEASNVDLADQFSKMIVTQRAYSSAATIVRTADEMTQAARDLKR